MKTTQNEKGVTLVELLAAVVILSIILVSIMNFFSQMAGINNINEDKSQAINTAKQELINWQDDDVKNFLKGKATSNIPSLLDYQDVNITGGSVLSVGGKAIINGKLRIDSNLDSLLCISTRANLDIDSKNIIIEDNQPEKHIITLNSDISLRNKCGFDTSNTDRVNWDDNISNSVDYEY